MSRVSQQLTTMAEQRVLRRLTTPAKIQDFLDTLPMNFEPDGDTCRAPRQVLSLQTAHCAEAAMLAAALLWAQGRPPLLLDLVSTHDDYDHVVALFRERGRWGAISKTNHAVLRYREPVYQTVRELAMSYFHEYIVEGGKKTLRTFSGAFDLRKQGTDWLTDDDAACAAIVALDDARHYNMLAPKQSATLRRADPIEVAAGQLTEWVAKNRRVARNPKIR